MSIGKRSSAYLLFILSACGPSRGEDECVCREATVATLPAPIASADGVTLVVTWADGSVTCQVTGVRAECDSNGTIDAEAEDQVIGFAVEVMNLGGSSQVGQVLPEIERVRIPGKQPEVTVMVEDEDEDTDVAFEASGDLTRGTDSSCGVCEHWAMPLVHS
jgi:hypothetical protein